MSKEPKILETIRAQKDMVEILQQYGITPPPVEDITITKRSVCERRGTFLMSDQILDATFPKSGPLEALHFTLPHVLPSILENGQLWLAPVARNINEGEYEEFAKEHHFASAQMDDMRRELAECYYYTSFSPVGTSAEQGHWDTFSAGGLGYCLRFHLDPKTADLRRIQYADGQKRLYTRINEEVKQRLARTLVPWGIARLSAFYLHEDLADEDEIRLLVANPPNVVDHNGQKHFAISLGADNEWCRVTLKEVVCGQSDDAPTVTEMLRRFGCDRVAVSARTA